MRVHFGATTGGVPVKFVPRFALDAVKDRCSFKLEPAGVYCEGPDFRMTVPFAAIRAIEYA